MKNAEDRLTHNTILSVQHLLEKSNLAFTTACKVVRYSTHVKMKNAEDRLTHKAILSVQHLLEKSNLALTTACKVVR